jgi:hypothetical protein
MPMTSIRLIFAWIPENSRTPAERIEPLEPVPTNSDRTAAVHGR